MTRHGGCLCGAVRFTAEGEPINVRVCHCRRCQKAMGSPFYARAMFEPKAVTISGEVVSYPSSETLNRVFCPACGTTLFSRRANGTAIGIALAAFDDRNAFAPTEHIWVSEKPAWMDIGDGLPQYQQGPT
ncbi:MAG: GFA family protein [Proteobacteria bacterium]|nr:GFA family protein [Pseudomonadota bacterium]